MKIRLLKRSGAVFSVLLLSTSFPSIALAQVVGEVAPPERVVTDDNGVNVSTGQYRAPRVEMVVGAGIGSISERRIYGRQIYSDAKIQLFSVSSLPGPVVVNTGLNTYTFVQSTNGYLPAPDGAKLVVINGIYQLILLDGTKLTYGAIEKASRHADSREYDFDNFAYLSSIEESSGLRTLLNWQTSSYCPYGRRTGAEPCQLSAPSNSGPPPQVWVTRLSSISNSAGFAIRYNYAGSALGGANGPTGAELAAWKLLTGATSENAQGGSGSLPSVTYAYSRSQISGGYVATDDVTDALNRTWRYTKRVDSSGGYEAVRRPDSQVDNVQANMDPQGHVTSIVKDGATWVYAFAVPNGSTTTLSVTDPSNRTKKYVSDGSVGLPTRVEDEYGRATIYTYDEKKRLKSATSPGGQVDDYQYDSTGNVVKVTTTSSSGLTMSSSATYQDYAFATGPANRISSSKDSSGIITSYGYDNNHGGLTSVTIGNPGGVSPSTQIRYSQVSGVWLPTTSWICHSLADCDNSSDAVKITNTYNANLLVSSSTISSGSGSLSSTTNNTYSAAGDVNTIDGTVEGSSDTTRYYYDAARQLVGVVGADPDGAELLARPAVRYTFDRWGRITDTAEGTASDLGDQALTNISVRQITKNTLLDTGRVSSSIVMAQGSTFSRTDYSYDMAGRPVCEAYRMNPSQFSSSVGACTVTTDPSLGSDRVNLTTYSPAGVGNPVYTSVTRGYGTTDAATESVLQTANGKVSSTTDSKGNVTSYAYDGFDRLQTTTYPGGSYEQLGYGANGSVTSQRKRDGRTLTFGYDALNRMTSKAVPDARSVFYAYDLTGAMTEAHFDSLGGSDYVKNAYNALGQVLTSTTSMGGSTRALSYTYDAAGNRSQITHPDGTTFRYDYDNLNRLNHLKDGANNQLGLYVYLDNGKLTWRGQGANGTGYGYDAMSRILSYNMQRLNGGSVTTVNTALSYNAASQIVQQTRNSDAYAYTDTRNVDRNFATNGLNQYTDVGPDKYSYDANGNLTSDGGNTYTYDAENRLTGVTGARSGSLIYDPVGRLWQTSGSSGASSVTQFLYDGDQLVAEYNSAGGLLRRYVQGTGNDDPLLWYEGASTSPYRLYTDHLGSVIGIIQDDGTVRQINTYDEYGVPGSGNLGRFQYTGQIWIPELGLYYYKARMYSPMLGRFMQVDPTGDSDGMNLYDYVHADPINGTDPTGLYCEKNDPCQLPPVYTGPDVVVEANRNSGSGISIDPRPIINLIGKGLKAINCSLLGGIFGGCGKHNAKQINLQSLPTSSSVSIPCANIRPNAGPVITNTATATAVVGGGPTGSLGAFTIPSTGQSGRFYSIGGGAGADISASYTGGFYRNAASLRGVSIGGGGSFGWLAVGSTLSTNLDITSAHLGAAFGVGGSATLTNTSLFSCYARVK